MEDKKSTYTGFTEARARANKKYMDKFVEIKVRVDSSRRDAIKAHADGQGESVNTFINRAIDGAMEHDREADIEESQRNLCRLRDINSTKALLMEIQEARQLLCGTTWCNVFYNPQLYPTDQDRQEVAAALVECADAVHDLFYRLAGTIPAGADASRLGSSNAQE